jgi:VCBS repeat-containing protein
MRVPTSATRMTVTATGATISTNENTPITSAVSSTGDNDSDVTYAKASDPQHGSVVVNSDGSYTYTPNAEYDGPDSFTFTATDEGDTSAPATVSITVNENEPAPTITVALSGIAVTGRPVTATPTITDADSGILGLGTTTYQWFVGNNPNPVQTDTFSGAHAGDADTYTQTADLLLAVKATYTDVETHQVIKSAAEIISGRPFSDTYAPPVVAATQSSFTLSHINPVAASTLFTAYERDGEPITHYDFWDNGSGGGHWSLNGMALASNQDNFVNAAQLSQVTYTPGAGTDTLWVRANDGIQYGAWSNPFTAIDTAPVSTPVQSVVSGALNKTFAATSLFTAADADSDSIVQYDFWNSGTGGGRWLLNGNPLGIGQDNFVPAAQLAQVTYKAGNGPEMIWERASDGLQFGAWSPAVPIVNAPIADPIQSAFTISHLHTVVATTLFTATDGDGDALTQYDFWDTGTGGAHWVINGQPGVINGDNIVTAAQLPQVSYQSGTGTDTLWVRVNDGTGFGPWRKPSRRRMPRR